MRKKLLFALFVMIIASMLFVITSSAATVLKTWDISATTDDNVTATLYNDYSLVISGTGNMKVWTVSSYVPWYYSYSGKIKSLTIENGVTSISDYAFFSCNSVTSVVIPDSVTSIGDAAFSCCTSLTSVVIGDSVTSIGSNAFEYCDSLTSVVIGNSVTSIGSYAFWCCDSLTIYCESESQPSGWSSIWNYSNRPVVWGHTHTYKNDKCVCGKEKPYVELWDISATTDDNVTAALYNDGALVISGTGNMKDWNYNGAPWYSSYSSKIISVTIENGVTSIGSWAFEDCTCLTNIEIPDSVTYIGSYAFSDCDSLTSIVIGDSVTYIGSYAFYHCDSLTNVVIPDSVTSIGDYAFSNCCSLTIYCEAESQPSGWDSDWNHYNRPVVWGYGLLSLGEIIVLKGYSIREDGTGSICVGYTINYDKLAKYEEQTGKTLDFGIVFAGYDNLKGNQPLNSDGTVITLEKGKVIKQSLVSLKYSNYDFVLNDITDSIKNTKFVINAYIYDGETVKYCTSKGISDIVYGISFNEINTPPTPPPLLPPDEF